MLSVALNDNRAFDGIICIGGEDWWYHNRGHFDFQIMRRLARDVPVLFVNSLGVRMPSLKHGGLFLTRIGRKLKSLGRGLVEAEPGFWVFSPVRVPGATGARLSDWALAPQIKLAAARVGMTKPVLWVHCPAGAALEGHLGEVASVLQRTDRFEAFPESDPAAVGRQIAHMKAQADLVVYAAPHLQAEERGEVRRSLLVTHGVELARFLEAGRATSREPADLAGIGRPRVGFVGGIDAHTFDPALFLEVVRRIPDAQFVLVGGSSLPEGWCQRRNVHMLGRKPYDEVADYMAAMDVLIMPWNRSDWIKACNPVKLKEYLAVGRAIVTTDFQALGPWRPHVTVADTAPEFAAAVRRGLEAGRRPVPPALAEMLSRETWDDKARLVLDALDELTSGGRSSAARPRAA